MVTISTGRGGDSGWRVSLQAVSTAPYDQIYRYAGRIGLFAKKREEMVKGMAFNKPTIFFRYIFAPYSTYMVALCRPADLQIRHDVLQFVLSVPSVH